MSEWSIDWNETKATEAVVELAALCRKAQAAMTPGKVMPMLVYKIRSLQSPRYYKSPDEASRAYAAARVEDEKAREHNAIAATNNIALFETLKKIVTSAGVGATDAVKKKGRGLGGFGYDHSPAAWIGSIASKIPTLDGWSSTERLYAEAIVSIEKWRSEIAEKEEKEKRAVAVEVKKREADRLIVVMATKYGIDVVSATWGDVLDAILSRNKYLRLAHYLSKNRGDWNDGPSYAREGLEGFKIETPEDAQIVKELSGYVSDWDGDGRVFRDCDWNYTKLFGMAQSEDNGLMADYQLASVNVEEVWA